METVFFPLQLIIIYFDRLKRQIYVSVICILEDHFKDEYL